MHFFKISQQNLSAFIQNYYWAENKVLQKRKFGHFLFQIYTGIEDDYKLYVSVQR